MRLRAERPPLRSTIVAATLVAMAACDGKPAADPNNREIPWTYGPTSSTATAEHMRGTGKEGGAAIAKGWNCRLLDKKRLTVTPYQLAASHPLFGKVTMSVALFDRTGKELASFLSPPITKENATFTFDVPETLVPQLGDLVLWYRKA